MIPAFSNVSPNKLLVSTKNCNLLFLVFLFSLIICSNKFSFCLIISIISFSSFSSLYLMNSKLFLKSKFKVVLFLSFLLINVESFSFFSFFLLSSLMIMYFELFSLFLNFKSSCSCEQSFFLLSHISFDLSCSIISSESFLEFWDFWAFKISKSALIFKVLLPFFKSSSLFIFSKSFPTPSFLKLLISVVFFELFLFFFSFFLIFLSFLSEFCLFCSSSSIIKLLFSFLSFNSFSLNISFLIKSNISKLSFSFSRNK